MRICLLGKYPPIAGGVSTSQYGLAYGLAARGHAVHVVTNAAEVEPPYRMVMRPADWRRCAGSVGRSGSVRVHWTRSDARQAHILAHNPMATKLASLAADAIRDADLEVIHASYLEPYGVAAVLASGMTGVPYVIQTAGSDIGRLREDPQLRPTYDHVFRHASRILTCSGLWDDLEALGIEPRRFRLTADAPPNVLDRLFAPSGPTLRLAGLHDGSGAPAPPYLGIYGKQGEVKGTFDLLRAAARLRRHGVRFTLLMLGRGSERTEEQVRSLVASADLESTVLRLPFLPPWRIPAFIRLCNAVCFLERGFPIAFHNPTVPGEILACGRCLVGSAEILSTGHYGRLIHGVTCVAVHDPRDEDELTARLAAVLTAPDLARAIGSRGGHAAAAQGRLQGPGGISVEALLADVVTEDRRRRPRAAAHGRRRATRSDRARRRASPERKRRDLATEIRRLRRLLRYSQSQADADTPAHLFSIGGTHLMSDAQIEALVPHAAHGLRLSSFAHDPDALIAAGRGDSARVTPIPTWVAGAPGSALAYLSPAARDLVAGCDGSRSIAELADAYGGARARAAVARAILVYAHLGLVRLEAPPG